MFFSVNRKCMFAVFAAGCICAVGCGTAARQTPAETAGKEEDQMLDYDKVRKKYDILVRELIEKQITITTMESCTSGQIASLLTDTEGASAIMKGAFVTYSNEAKIRQGVPSEVIDRYGVYSKETASEMARVCRDFYGTDIGIGVTGSFGNTDPNNPDSVPGKVYFAIATGEQTEGYDCKVPPQPTRLAYKLYMADIIADELIRKIKK